MVVVWSRFGKNSAGIEPEFGNVVATSRLQKPARHEVLKRRQEQVQILLDI